MESKGEEVNLGRSVIVPSVQELAKQSLTNIPPRYIHDHHHHHQNQEYDSKLPSPSVPIIDLQNLIFHDDHDVQLVKLHNACQQWGFFQVVNHGVSASLLEDFRTEIVNFFKLPLEEKKKLWQQPDNQEGFGQLFVTSAEQQLDWCDIFYITTLPASLRKTHLFENLPPILREKVEAYSLEVKKLAVKILGQIAKALEMDGQEMIELFSNGMQSMRMNYYPPCPEPDRAIGLTPHSDAGALTILFQLNETEGLEIRKDGRWIPIKPLPNAFVVNVGDMLEILSNGVYRSIEHRATVNSAKERLSIATFYSSNLDSEVGPAKSLVGPDRPAIFRRIHVDKYYKEFFAQKLNGKANRDSNILYSLEPKTGGTI